MKFEIGNKMKFKNVMVIKDPLAKLPIYAHLGDGAADVHAFLPEEAVWQVPPDGIVRVPTGLKFAIPEGYGLLIIPRSGVSLARIKVANSPGLLDCGYQGELMILLHNQSQESFTIKNGIRIAQITLVELPKMRFIEIDSFDNMTERGEGGFGSSGL